MIEKSRSVYDRVQRNLFPPKLLKAASILLRAFPEKTERYEGLTSFETAPSYSASLQILDG